MAGLSKEEQEAAVRAIQWGHSVPKGKVSGSKSLHSVILGTCMRPENVTVLYNKTKKTVEIHEERKESTMPFQKIQVIKRFRELTNFGLKEAKDAIEKVMLDLEHTTDPNFFSGTDDEVLNIALAEVFPPDEFSFGRVWNQLKKDLRDSGFQAHVQRMNDMEREEQQRATRVKREKDFRRKIDNLLSEIPLGGCGMSDLPVDDQIQIVEDKLRKWARGENYSG